MLKNHSTLQSIPTNPMKRTHSGSSNAGPGTARCSSKTANQVTIVIVT